eukprot:1720210-Amphidinium_carterae.1
MARSGIASEGTAILMGAKTGRGTGNPVEFKYVLKNTFDPEKAELLKALHALAGTHPNHISYTSVVVTKLKKGQGIKPHRDVKNDDNVPNHTICFGNYGGGQLQVERESSQGVLAWELVGLPEAWISFYARSLKHKVAEIEIGERYSITYYTPGNLDVLPTGDW